MDNKIYAVVIITHLETGHYFVGLTTNPVKYIQLNYVFLKEHILKTLMSLL